MDRNRLFRANRQVTFRGFYSGLLDFAGFINERLFQTITFGMKNNGIWDLSYCRIGNNINPTQDVLSQTEGVERKTPSMDATAGLEL